MSSRARWADIQENVPIAARGDENADRPRTRGRRGGKVAQRQRRSAAWQAADILITAPHSRSRSPSRARSEEARSESPEATGGATGSGLTEAEREVREPTTAPKGSPVSNAEIAVSKNFTARPESAASSAPAAEQSDSSTPSRGRTQSATEERRELLGSVQPPPPRRRRLEARNPEPLLRTGLRDLEDSVSSSSGGSFEEVSSTESPKAKSIQQNISYAEAVLTGKAPPAKPKDSGGLQLLLFKPAPAEPKESNQVPTPRVAPPKRNTFGPRADALNALRITRAEIKAPPTGLLLKAPAKAPAPGYRAASAKEKAAPPVRQEKAAPPPLRATPEVKPAPPTLPFRHHVVYASARIPSGSYYRATIGFDFHNTLQIRTRLRGWHVPAEYLGVLRNLQRTGYRVVVISYVGSRAREASTRVEAEQSGLTEVIGGERHLAFTNTRYKNRAIRHFDCVCFVDDSPEVAQHLQSEPVCQLRQINTPRVAHNQGYQDIQDAVVGNPQWGHPDLSATRTLLLEY